MYLKINPDPELRNYVESIWVQENLEDAAANQFEPTTVLPAAKTDFLFHYLDSFEQLTENGNEELPKFFLCGHRTKPVKVKAKGKTGIIIVSMHPWGITYFLNEPVHRFTDMSVDLFDVYRHDKLYLLQEELFSEKNIMLKVKAVQTFLKSVLKENSDLNFIPEVTKIINTGLGNIRVSKIAGNFQISRRHLHREFQNKIGLTPKEFSEIIRFQKAIAMLKSGFDWEQTAFNIGYYDQSHFIREIKRFTGKSPNELNKSYNNSKLQSTFNTTSFRTGFYNTVYL